MTETERSYDWAAVAVTVKDQPPPTCVPQFR
jgi:hypothetical protein